MPAARTRRAPRAVTLLAGVLAAPGVLAGCSAGPVQVEGALLLDDLPAEQRAACAALLEDLPDEVGGEEERDVAPEGVAARAWGTPATVVVCGAELPASFTDTSDCEVVGEVGWYAEPATYQDQTVDVVVTTIGQEPTVQLRLPAERRPPVEEEIDVAPAILAHTELVDPCF
ncbi:DUF3515 family protein [Nocardioides sp. ChNu-153]|uniref:DUF3515 family protein n=1 Tax=unclassified Nocardioides TaxID=2615069 RepID=UPI0024077263|nr:MULTISPECIES: DUF3515 family protein [unclassified Nocardioides]MDF9716944.1 DUF3515 domain-containing protein [Nocardioides sp. ChNu-99]MDN7122649.1 DUF3515 family protein [Nocardioides sp. ChNu-153]